MGALTIINNLIFGTTIAALTVIIQCLVPISYYSPVGKFGVYLAAIVFAVIALLVLVVLTLIANIKKLSQKVSAMNKAVIVGVAALSLLIAMILFAIYANLADPPTTFQVLKANTHLIVSGFGVICLIAVVLGGLLVMKRNDY